MLDFNSRSMREAEANEALNEHIGHALQKKNEKQAKRSYLGASAIGHDCERSIQFEYAGAPREKPYPYETLIKFDLGHMGEEMSRFHFIDAGFVLKTTSPKGEEYAFSQLNGRFKGHVDGVFLSGPQIPGVGYPCLWETKSVGSKTYRTVIKDGLKRARPGYYTQVAVYAAYLKLTDHPAIFTVTNLDTGERVHLLIPFDAEEAQRATDKAVRIIKATEAEDLLPRPFADKTHFICKMCAFSERCWSLPA